MMGEGGRGAAPLSTVQGTIPILGTGLLRPLTLLLEHRLPKKMTAPGASAEPRCFPRSTATESVQLLATVFSTAGLELLHLLSGTFSPVSVSLHTAISAYRAEACADSVTLMLGIPEIGVPCCALLQWEPVSCRLITTC